MEKAKAWLKAHWKPVLAVALAAAAAAWLLLRKKSSPATAVTLPGMAGGGTTGGGTTGGGTSGGDTGGSPISPAAPAGPLSFMQWLQQTWNPSYLTKGHGSLNQWINDLVATYAQQTGQQAVAIPKTGGLLTAPTVPSYEWFQGQYAAGGWQPPTAQRITKGETRGSGFRGGDVYPPYAGASAKDIGSARNPSQTAGPAPALGTPILPKQLATRDVRLSARRQTAITQLARGNDPVPLPQSFSVPIREHQEGTRPVLTVRAQTPVDATQAPDPQTPIRIGYTAPAIPPSTRRRWRY